jgi:hypothetical protein
MYSEDLAELQRIDARLRDLHVSLCRQKVEMLNSLGVIVEERLSSPINVAKVAEPNEKLSHIEAMQGEVYRKW